MSKRNERFSIYVWSPAFTRHPPAKRGGKSRLKAGLQTLENLIYGLLSSFLIKAQNLAKEVEHKKFRDNWFYTQKGVLDTLNSVKEIFVSIDEKFLNNIENFNQLGINLSKDEHLRVIETLKIGSQVELKNHNIWQNMSNLSEVWLLLVLYKKNPLYGGAFTTEAIEQNIFIPEINYEKKVVWKNKQNATEVLSPNQLSEKCFENLIKEITGENSNNISIG